MVKKLQKMLKRAPGDQDAVVTSQKVDIGNGVLVDESTLERIRPDSKNSGSRFARSLMRALFTPEELTNKSLFRRKCNSHKESVTKEALDPLRVNAIIGGLAVLELSSVPAELQGKCCAWLQRLGSPLVYAVLEGALDGFRRDLEVKMGVPSGVVEASFLNKALREARLTYLEDLKENTLIIHWRMW
ncbi:hypothetical protein MTO96_050461 [Rhipicephalus appendiculatus]